MCFSIETSKVQKKVDRNMKRERELYTSFPQNRTTETL